MIDQISEKDPAPEGVSNHVTISCNRRYLQVLGIMLYVIGAEHIGENPAIA